MRFGVLLGSCLGRRLERNLLGVGAQGFQVRSGVGQRGFSRVKDAVDGGEKRLVGSNLGLPCKLEGAHHLQQRACGIAHLYQTNSCPHHEQRLLHTI